MLYPKANRFRRVQTMTGFWDFKVDEDNVGEGKGWQRGEYGNSRPIALNASWNELFPELRNYLGTCWYFKKVYLPPEWKGHLIWLRIGEASYFAKAWVNGHYLGSHEGGQLPFQFKITEKAKLGEENLIAISVNKILSENTNPQGNLNASQVATFDHYPNFHLDYFPYAGIHRPVIIYTTPSTYIEDVTVKTEIKGEDGIVTYSIKTAGKEDSKVRVSLSSGEGKEVSTVSQAKDGIAEGKLLAKKARLWSPCNPVLYNLSIEILGKEVIDEYSLPIGIRTIKVEGNQLLLNGRPVYLRGFGKHEDFPVIGKGMSEAVIVKDFAMLEWINANSFRTAHYPYAEEIMEMADRKGYLVIDEIPASQFSRYMFTNERIRDLCKQYIKELIQRDKNHPSVIMWNVANEPESNFPEAEGFFKDLYDTAKQCDQTRPATMVSCIFHFSGQDDVALKYFDVICLNMYFGWYSITGQLEEADRRLSERLDDAYKTFGKPIMVTEFGADAVSGMHTEPPELFTEEYQAELIRRQCCIIESKPYTFGTHIWNFADFKTCQHYWRVVYNLKGVFTRERQPKMAARMLKQLWSNPWGSCGNKK